METVSVEVYSDNEDGTRPGVIDIDAVSGLSESAPTSVYRARDLDGGKALAKAKEKEKIKAQKERRRRQKAVRAAVTGDGSGTPGGAGTGDVFVKAEPVSPSRPGAPLPPTGEDVDMEREGDSMIPADQTQDRDEAGRRVRATTSGSSEDVNEAQRVDLSESEDEEFEEDLGGDFVLVPGGEHPEDKLFTFQFPHMFPKFKPPPVPAEGTEVGADGASGGAAGGVGSAAGAGAGPGAPGTGAAGAGGVDKKEDTKPRLTGAAGRKKPDPPPTGRIGSLVVLKSGKVKMVMGSGDDAVVMDVSPGVSPSFLQTLVHVDQKNKALAVAGEVHKSYVVTPDVDRLLDELFINGGETPGDKEKRALRQVKLERGVKMELD